jgi:hypothetical protein
MKNGQCPKCHSTNIFKNVNGIDWGNEGSGIGIWIGSINSRSIAWSDCDSYICADCGYFENYILDKDVLQKVQAKWKKVIKSFE